MSRIMKTIAIKLQSPCAQRWYFGGLDAACRKESLRWIVRMRRWKTGSDRTESGLSSAEKFNHQCAPSHRLLSRGAEPARLIYGWYQASPLLSHCQFDPRSLCPTHRHTLPELSLLFGRNLDSLTSSCPTWNFLQTFYRIFSYSSSDALHNYR